MQLSSGLTFFSTALLGNWDEDGPFHSCGQGWVFQMCWHIECSTSRAPSFRILNSSAGISSSPLALWAAVLHKAHLTSHSRMSGSEWVTTPTPSWLSRSLRSFLYSSYMYSFHLFLNSSASIRSLPVSVLYYAYLWMKCSSDISNFLKEISSLSPSAVFPLFLSIVH